MNHMWAAITVVPVEIIPPKTLDEDPEVICRQADANDTQYGCSACGSPLNSETYRTQCSSS